MNHPAWVTDHTTRSRHLAYLARKRVPRLLVRFALGVNNSRISGFCTTAQVKFPKTDLADIATCREELARVGCSPECIDAAVRRYAEHRAPPRGKTTTSSRAGGKATRPPPVIGKNPKPRAVETPRVKDEPIEIRKPSTEETHAFYAQLIAATGR